MSNLGHVIALDPTEEQANAFARAAGTARFTYNWALGEWNRIRAEGGKTNLYEIKKRFNTTKRDAYPWMMESPRDASSQPFADLQAAFTAFFASLSGKRKGRKVAHPIFRKKGQSDSFYVANDRFRFDDDGNHVILSVIGKVRIHEPLRLAGKILSGRVTRTAGRWYLSVHVEGEFRRPTTPTREIVGVDLGLTTAIVTSVGDHVVAPKPLKKSLKALRKAQQQLSRRTKGGKNREKSKRRVARIHARVANVRKDFMHKVTTRLVRENQAVVIEDLNVAGMLKNHCLARAISDVGFGMFRRMMEYKAPLYGCELIVADRWFPSSKTCHRCGVVKTEMSLSDRVFRCDACGLVMDRDDNASMNLETYPRFAGNAPRGETPMDIGTSTRSAFGRRASAVVEVGTQP